MRLGDRFVRYKLWIEISLVLQVVSALLPSILLRENALLEFVFGGITLAIVLIATLIQTASLQRFLAYGMALYGLVLTFTLVVLNLSSPALLVFMLAWSMAMTQAYSREIFLAKYFIIFMSSVVVLFSSGLLLAPDATYTFAERAPAITSGLLIIAINIYRFNREVGTGANHYSESRKRYDDIATLSGKMSAILSSTKSLPEMLQQVSEECIPLLQLDNCTIYLYDEESDQLVQVKHDRKGPSISPGTTVIGACFETATPIMVADLQLSSYAPLPSIGNNIHAEIAVPIFKSGHVAGVIHSYHQDKDFFRDRHFQAFNVIASFCGIKMTQKDAEESIRDAERTKAEMDRIRELDELKNRFLTNISHDLKTPLSLIKAPARQIAEISKESKVKKLSTYIVNNADHLMRVVHQLLQLNRIEKGLNELYIERVDLAVIGKKIAGQYEERAESRSIEFTINIEDIQMQTDSFRLEQILHNLLSNAFRYSNDGGLIGLKVSSNGQQIEIEISDTGKGIAPELHERIFERFYKVDVNNHEGTGIGLSLVKEYTESLEGLLALESAPGVGTVFKLTFPLVHSESTQHQELQKSEVSDLDALGSVKPQLLVVEDHVDLNNFICTFFEHDFHCIPASDGREALVKIEQQLPDIIITDLMMPHMDGRSLVEKIRSNDELAHIPIIVLTAKSHTDSKIDLYQLGVDNYIAKPFDIEELNAIVKAALTQRKKLRDTFRNRYLEHVPVEPLMEVQTDHEPATKVASETVQSNLVEEARTLIFERLDDDQLTVGDLATELGYGRNRFQKEIKELSGLTPVEFVRSIRLNEAKNMLQDKRKSVSEVAYAVGFNNLSYFTRSFRQEFGILPSEVE